jgi:hypothetical protein
MKEEEKYYCKKDYYNKNCCKIFYNGRYYNVYDENNTSGFKETETVWVVYNSHGGFDSTGLRFWIEPDEKINYDAEFIMDKFSDYFISLKELRMLKLEKLKKS